MSTTLSFLKELNPAQLEIVRTLNGPLLVIAGAGSGKTKTLVCRMAYLVAQGVKAENILLLTFTRKAAREMIERASALLKIDCSKIMGGTFHSLSQYMLRFYGYLLGYSPNFTILDRADAEDLLHLLKNSLGFANKKKFFPRKNTLLSIYSKIVNQKKTLEEVLSKEYPQFLDFCEDIKKLFTEYNNYKKEHNLMDYEDLLVNWLEILKNFPEVRNEIGERFEFCMVDEYQDTNSLQGEIIKYMAEKHNNIMVVGDDSQSIYGFRGADYKNIFEFPKIFKNTKIIKLEENYRSTQPILNLANAVISNAKIKYTKVLYTKKKEGEKPILFYAKDEAESSKFIAERILELVEKGIKLSQIAVLFRSAFHSFDLEVELTKRNIPFIKFGGLKLLESAHVKDFLAILKIYNNPLDFLSWNRILLLLEGIGPRTAEKIIEKLKNINSQLFSPLSLNEPKVMNLLSQFFHFKEFKNLLSLFQNLKNYPHLSQKLIAIWEFYEPIFQRIYYEDYHRRQKDIEGLISLSQKYESLEEFLAELSIEPIETAEPEMMHKQGEYLTLSTIHSAKGLEWHTVFIISLVEGRFPSAYSLQNEEELEEERRLFYVAITRAREKLYLIVPTSIYKPGEGKILTQPSRFIKEIPPSLFKVYQKEESSRNLKTRSATKSNNNNFKVGDLVKHPHFGEGEILEILDDNKIKVFFPKKGVTHLHLDYVKLEKII